jgi:quinol monooxygenase YgiN
MIVGMLRIPLAPNRHAEVLEVLRSIQGPVLAQPGCKAYHIYDEQGLEPAVVLVERWESRATLEAHIRSDIYRRILGAIELAGGPPEISFEVVSAREGMELIERLRRLGGSENAP